MPFPPSAACRFFDIPPVNLQNLPLHLTKNSFASAPTHLCGIAFTKRFRLCGGEAGAFRSPPPPLRCDYPATMWWPTLAGRGGSVSRRDRNPKTRKRAQATWVRKFAGAVKLIPSYSSGGSAREGKTAIAASGGRAWLSFSTETSGHRPRRLRLRKLLLEAASLAIFPNSYLFFFS